MRKRGVSYTEIIIAVDLRQTTPPHVIEALRTMADKAARDSRMPLPEHPLFATPRWSSLLSGSSGFFPALPISSWRPGETGGYRFAARANAKCAHDEPMLLFDFMAPYVDDGSSDERVYIGQYQADTDVDPTLVYLVNGKVRVLKLAPELFHPPSLKAKAAMSRKSCPVVNEHDTQDSAVRRAMSDAVRDVLREIVKDRPHALIRDLQRHQLVRVADSVVAKFIQARTEQTDLENLLGRDEAPDFFG